MTKLTEQILRLRSEGKTYDEIKAVLGCSKSTISYHCGEGQKKKTYQRHVKRRKKHPFVHKLENFKQAKKRPKRKLSKTTVQKLLKAKLEAFARNRKNKMEYIKPSFNVQDVIDKFGENTVCYLTGKPININEPKTYHFDHIIPVSKGGDNTIENLGICTREANLAKSDMTHEQFIQLCRDVIKHQDQAIGVGDDPTCSLLTAKRLTTSATQ